MLKSVEDVLMSYKECTEHIVEILKREEFNSLKDEMEKRQCILNELISDKYNKDEVKKFYRKFDINDIESKAEKLMKDKALLIKKKLKNISVNKTASSAYGNIGSSAKIFSKKI
ncbi:hypothetical protein [Clostridium tyrobutyricum]|uniref:hypothetical protein n=1 Tax=Clostridium tyrobutyricum TaxID=1519 RepID=UPI0010AA6873|nr:hypothetical protein [Clostridium tyrobutyricum]MBV4416558.1 hypothetical protein [Clostridium tyrobutyricum]MBV4421986.1 hypothetical protein [Clostridium tyrobutyricum]QCH26963.1 hypothetical protein EZN00_00552 [Clostridium tyrobutyricum]